MSDRPTFIERHGLWTDEDRRRRRASWRAGSRPRSSATCGSPGATPMAIAGRKRSPCRLSSPPCRCRLQYRRGHDRRSIPQAQRVFASFTRGGGMGLERNDRVSPNLTLVADPEDVSHSGPGRRAPAGFWATNISTTGGRLHFAPRQLLKKALQATALPSAARHLHHRRGDRMVSAARRRRAFERGQYRRAGRSRPSHPHVSGGARLSLSFRIQHGPDAAGVRRARRQLRCAGASTALDRKRMGVRDRVECTFAPCAALDAADNVLLFRTATRQICRRLGYFATFMARPALKGFYASGWHLHQSLIESSRRGQESIHPGKDRATVLFPARPVLSRRPPAPMPCPPLCSSPPRPSTATVVFAPNSLAPDRAASGLATIAAP